LNIPRWARDKVRSAAIYKGVDQNEFFMQVVLPVIEQIEAERGEPLPYIPLAADLKRGLGPSF
jgi:hypothetical protein